MLSFSDENENVVERNKIYDFRNDDSSKWKGNGCEGNKRVDISNSNVYGLSFNNGNKWNHFMDFAQMTNHNISNGQSLGYNSRYPEEMQSPLLGPSVLINAVKCLSGNDPTTWAKSLFGICCHFFESVRNTRIQDAVESAFTFE